jgi:hypothetical protein
VDSLGQVFFSDDGAYVVRKLNTAGIVSTIAGTGTKGTVNFYVAASSSNIGDPRGLTGDTAGNIYFYDNYANYIFKVTSLGSLSIAVGTGSSLFSMGYAATSTLIGTPYNILLATDGTLYMADSARHRISKVNIFATGALSSVVAGTGDSYLGGDGGSAVSAVLSGVTGLYLDSSGSLHFLDSGNFRIRKIDINGIVSAVCGSIVIGVSGSPTDNVAATSSYLNLPFGVFGDTVGNIYISDLNNGRVRKVSTWGIITTYAGGGTVINENGPATSSALSPFGFYVTTDGNLFIADASNCRIRKVTPTGIISTVAGNGDCALAGDGGLASLASIRGPRGLFVVTNGDIFIADTDNSRIRKVSAATNIITTVAGKGSELKGGYSGDNGPATSAMLNFPTAIYYDIAANKIYFTDFNNRIRMFSLSNGGIISTLTSIGSNPGDLICDKSGNLYYTQSKYVYKIASGTTISTLFAGNGVGTFSGDGGPARSAGVSTPKGIYMDTTGVVYFSDVGHYRIRKVGITGIITTMCGTGSSGMPTEGIAASSSTISEIYSLFGDTLGNLYLADYTYHKIRVIDTSGILTTFAGTGASGYSASHEGGLASSATLYNPKGIWIDSQSNLFLADRNNNRIRKISIFTTIITTVAGNGGTTLGVGDGGAPTSASINLPEGIWGDSIGNLFIAEFGNHRIRKVDLVNNIISTIAGYGTSLVGSRGVGTDGVLSTDSFLNGLRTITMDTIGTFYTSDIDNYKVRRLVITNSPTAQPSCQPSSQPSFHPTAPSGQPTHQPTSQPSVQPTLTPSRQPSMQPFSHPSSQPAATLTNPTSQPSRQPSTQPTTHPIFRHSKQPSRQPTYQPTIEPSGKPSLQPYGIPTIQPTAQPFLQPTVQPSTSPTAQPTCPPTSPPSAQPTTKPSQQPTNQPTIESSPKPSQSTRKPSTQPTEYPTSQPSSQPSRMPTVRPTMQPTMQPFSNPSAQPFFLPTTQPSGQPSYQPLGHPTNQPSTDPTAQPTS